MAVDEVANGVPAAVAVTRADEEVRVPDVATDQGIGDKLRTIFNGLTEVKVVTIVQDVALDVSAGHGRTTASFKPFDQQVPALVTIFNMIDGDVINVVAPSLEDNAALRAFHTAQVETSLAVLPANVEALVSFGRAIIKEFS